MRIGMPISIAKLFIAEMRFPHGDQMFPGQKRDMPAGDLTTRDILHLLNLDFQYTQMGRPPSKEEIANAIDSLTPRRMDPIMQQHGNKLYY